MRGLDQWERLRIFQTVTPNFAAIEAQLLPLLGRPPVGVILGVILEVGDVEAGGILLPFEIAFHLSSALCRYIVDEGLLVGSAHRLQSFPHFVVGHLQNRALSRLGNRFRRVVVNDR